jgi:tetratricopeptide (TPR) repeat protein
MKMTPKRFFDTEGGAFAHTELDDRAGLEHGPGGFRMAEVDERVKTLSASVFSAVKAKAEEGSRCLEAGDFRGAFKLFMEALKPLPEPKQQWNAAGWLLVALGENAIRAGNFEAAAKPFEDAMYCPGTIGNPWVHLRLGQVRFELGELELAADELSRAYMGGGRDVFEGQEPKYFELVESVLEPPPGMDRLP